MDEHYRQLVVYWRDAHARSPFPRVCCTVCPRQQAGVHARATLFLTAWCLLRAWNPGERSRASRRRMCSTPSRAKRCARRKWKTTP